MTRNVRRIALFLIGWTLTAYGSNASTGDDLFGRNQPTSASKGWKSVQGEGVRVLYPVGNFDALANRSLDTAESARREVAAALNASPTRLATLMLFPSRKEALRSNVPDNELDEGIRAWTPLLKHRYPIIFDGSFDALDHDIRHAVTHAIQTELMYGGGACSVVGLEPLF
ncbi:MAG: hypothetical protein O3A46_14450, partial [Candidatus Poribacteria bacterium]|nr:hypothetical protein [Candidatus Poribacteria bacterium]